MLHVMTLWNFQLSFSARFSINWSRVCYSHGCNWHIGISWISSSTESKFLIWFIYLSPSGIATTTLFYFYRYVAFVWSNSSGNMGCWAPSLQLSDPQVHTFFHPRATGIIRRTKYLSLIVVEMYPTKSLFSKQSDVLALCSSCYVLSLLSSWKWKDKKLNLTSRSQNSKPGWFTRPSNDWKTLTVMFSEFFTCVQRSDVHSFSHEKDLFVSIECPSYIFPCSICRVWRRKNCRGILLANCRPSQSASKRDQNRAELFRRCLLYTNDSR